MIQEINIFKLTGSAVIFIQKMSILCNYCLFNKNAI